jgi:gliding motility-associated-like protein
VKTWPIYFIALALSLTSPEGLAQSNATPPNLKNASVINEQGDVRLTWELTDTLDSDINIARDSLFIDAYVKIHTITDTSIQTWTDRNSTANKKSRSYKLDYNLEIGGVPSSNKFNTIHTKISLDTCKKENNLVWSRHVQSSKYINFNDTIAMARYNLWRSVDGGSYEKIATNDPSDTTYTDQGIEYDRIYKYYVEGVRAADTSIKSKSNRVSINTGMPDDPDYINFDRLQADKKQVKMVFSIAPNSELLNYVLLRSENLEGPYDTLQTFNKPDNTVEYKDESLNPLKEIFYYHLASVNQCGALTTRSDTFPNILLKVTKDEMSSMLEWNEMGHMPSSGTTYNVYRKIGDGGAFTLLESTVGSPYRDTEIASFRGKNVSSRFCYKLEAEVNPAHGQGSKVVSPGSCVYMEPGIFIPNAFTPNGDGKNDAFKPEFTFIPRHYLLIIYSRTGMKVFESRNAKVPWRGRIGGGRKAPGGTYTYYLEVQNPGDEIIRKRGQITLIYPD